MRETSFERVNALALNLENIERKENNLSDTGEAAIETMSDPADHRVQHDKLTILQLPT